MHDVDDKESHLGSQMIIDLLISCTSKANNLFTHLPLSNACDAIGDSSTFKNNLPSFGRLLLGLTTSQETCARAL